MYLATIQHAISEVFTITSEDLLGERTPQSIGEN